MLGGCAVQPPSAPESAALPPARVEGVPFFAQTDQQCGPAALAMVMSWAGHPATPAGLADQVMSPARDGSLQPSLIAAARRAGLLAYPLSGEAALAAELAGGHPVIVLQNLGLSWLPAWHYAVVTGRDATTVTLHSGTRKDAVSGVRMFRRTWDRAGRWGLVVLPAGQLPASADPLRYADAVMGLEHAGASAGALRAWAAGTRRWPATDVLWIGLANAYHARGDGDTALAALQEATRHAPESAVVWNNLAQLHLERGDGPAAVAAARRAVALGGPHAPTARVTLSAAEQAASVAAKRCPCAGPAAAVP